MRCPDCEKFVSYAEPEVEVLGEEFEGEVIDGKILTITTRPEVRIVLPCGECGTELKEYTFSLEMQEEHECKKIPKDPSTYNQNDIEIDGNIDAQPTERYREKDRHGKPIKLMRYKAHIYGVKITATATCPFCKEEIQLSGSDEIEASGMDELA